MKKHLWLACFKISSIFKVDREEAIRKKKKKAKRALPNTQRHWTVLTRTWKFPGRWCTPGTQCTADTSRRASRLVAVLPTPCRPETWNASAIACLKSHPQKNPRRAVNVNFAGSCADSDEEESFIRHRHGRWRKSAKGEGNHPPPPGISGHVNLELRDKTVLPYTKSPKIDARGVR